MKEPFKFFIERTTPVGKLARIYREYKLRLKYIKWESRIGDGSMPNWGKQQTVIGYIKRHKPVVFIETGTYKGKMVYAVQPYIQEIYSIELDEIRCRRAQERFAGYPNIHIQQGQSGEVLPEILKNIDKPCLFWLDAHYSGDSTAKADRDTPVMQELQCILNHKKSDEHIILIDDARCFTGQNDYPALESLQDFILDICPNWTFEVKDDIIRIDSGNLAGV